MKITITDEKARRGYATIAKTRGIEIALWHDSLEGLQKAFEAITGGAFHPILSQPVALLNLTKHEK